MPPLDTSAASLPLYLSLSKPRAAWRWSALPADGVGLLRLADIIVDEIGVHPMALLYFERVTDADARRQILELTRMYPRKEELFVEVIARHLARVALQYAPRRIFVCFSDATSTDYARLVGGSCFEPRERRPALGLRGAARYLSSLYRPAFELECQAVYRAREHFGAINISVILPFCRTIEEADQVLDIMVRQGLHRGKEDFLVHLLAEVPSNIILASELAARFDGFSVGTWSLAQLIYGTDGSSPLMRHMDLCGDAVRRAITELVARAHQAATPVHVCGATVMAAGFLEFLVTAGVDAITVRPEDYGRARERIRMHQGESRHALRTCEPDRAFGACVMEPLKPEPSPPILLPP